MAVMLEGGRRSDNIITRLMNTGLSILLFFPFSCSFWGVFGQGAGCTMITFIIITKGKTEGMNLSSTTSTGLDYEEG